MNVAVRVALPALLLCHAASATAPDHTAIAQKATDDSSAFAAVVTDLLADTAIHRPGGSLHVDPRPLANGRHVSVSLDELRARESTIRSLGAVPDDAEIPAGCGGTLLPAAGGSDPHKGCPRTWRRVAATEQPRGDRTPGRAVVPRSNRRIIHVVVSDIGPSGVTSKDADYVLERSQAGRWTVVARRNVIIMD